ncbi:hypothetical protein B0H66DRAFT_610726 [Apodospora peruviana]|uniref:Uncharacterized protein n=1 Tax=Apodospora peruviana TaxID=516989 RepID=A0AAE0IRH2_9PEZI|nr:hypothetical protein B0H66DRAFT_610726 [Apodospora peruviana]
MAQKNNNNNTLTSRLHHNYVLNPITALAFYHAGPGRTYVLAGEDTWLKVYHVSRSRLLGQLRIFHSQPIHGIHVSSPSDESPANCRQETRLLIWGGQSVTVVPQASLDILIQGNTDISPPRPTEFRAPDWIYDGILFPSDTNRGVLVTAHNETVPFRTSGDGQSKLAFGPLTSPSRPILYSANLCWLSEDSILVAGGTVFGEIIVWKYYVDATTTRPSQWELHFVFTGHEGSIFGVSISPEIELAPGVKVRLLASCSDDRTIRIWDITHRSISIEESSDASDTKALADARETGFGGNSEVKLENKNDSSRCLAVAMGHLSRIWHVKFAGRTNHHAPPHVRPIEVYSFGEDCTKQKWELSLDLQRWQNAPDSEDTKAVGTLKHCGTSPCHIGKNIWSAAVSSVEDESPIIVSGGADGKIAISGDQYQAHPDSISLEGSYSDLDINLSLDKVLQSLGTDVLTSPEAQIKKSTKEGFQRYAFLSEQTFLATTTAGRLFLGTVGNTRLTWEMIALPEAVVVDLKSYNVIKSPIKGSAILGSGTGKLYLFQQESQKLLELTRLPGKISDIICLDGLMQQQPESWTVVVTVLGLDHAMMLTFNTSAAGETVMASKRRIDLIPGFMVTAAAFCGSKLLLGSRIGVLAVYKTTTNIADGFELPEISRKDCKTKDAITCIVPLPDSSTSFLAGCRDGRYRIYTISKETDETNVLHLQHEISPPLGMIEGAWFTRPNPPQNGQQRDIELVLYGFRGNNFVVWSEASRQELASVECGGAHRPFDYISPASVDSGKMKLVFTKASEMRFYSQQRPVLRALKEGGHGREIRGIAASSFGNNKYLATAAEDTTIRIWQYKDNEQAVSRGFKCLAVLEKHSAGIQCLKWHGDEYLLSSAGNEEFFIWRVTRLESDYDALAVVCEAVYADRSPDGDLRIMDFDVQAWDGKDAAAMLISLALSNSTIRSYLYSREQGFRLLSTGHYTGACLTQIRHLQVSSSEMHVLTASTDGYVAVWLTTNFSAESEVVAEYSIRSVAKLHQSSVKSLDIATTTRVGGATRRWLVATGGDDNALGFLDLIGSSSNSKEGEKETREITMSSRSRVKDAHAAAVTGLCYIKEAANGQEDGGDVDSVVLATVSNDQRVKLWRAERRDQLVAGPGLRVSLLSNQYSSVADAGDLEVIAAGRLMVGGVGMEVWDVLRGAER